jgi:hypothetical protein
MSLNLPEGRLVMIRSRLVTSPVAEVRTVEKKRQHPEAVGAQM